MPLRQYRACVVDSLGLRITCVLYHSSMCTRHPNLVSSAFYAIPIFHIIILRIFNLLEMKMSVLQEVKGLTKNYTSSKKTSFHAKFQAQCLHGLLF